MRHKYGNKIPKELFIEGDISCVLRKHNKKFYPIMKDNEQIGEFNFFTLNLNDSFSILLNDKISEEDFNNSFQIFANIFNKLKVDNNEQIFFDYFTTSKKITNNMTRESRKGRSAIYDTISRDRKTLSKSVLHKHNYNYSAYFFRKNTVGNFYMIERENKYFIINKNQKDNMLQNNISFNAVGCESLPYKIDRTDKEVIDLTLSNEITIDDINLVLSEYSGDKTISYEANKRFSHLTMMHFYSEGNFKLPSIRLDKNDKSEEISYYVSKIDYTEIKDVSDIAQNMYTSQMLIRDKNIRHNTLISHHLRSTNSSIKHKEEERPIKMFEEAQEREYLDYEHDYENHDWGF